MSWREVWSDVGVMSWREGWGDVMERGLEWYIDVWVRSWREIE